MTEVETRLPAVLAGSTGFLLNKAAQRAREHFERALAPLGLRSRHYGVLALLAEAGPLAQGEVGERLRVDRTTMVAVVDDLERLGLAERQRAPQDRRAYALAITPPGRHTLDEGRQLLATVEAELLAALSTDERRQLHALLALLV